jgi:L-cysteate sulfo-lyase
MQQVLDLAATSFASSTTCCTKLWRVRLTRSSRAASCNRTVNCRSQPPPPSSVCNVIGDRNGAIQALGERLRQEGRRPYFVPYGVSNALGAVGYASTIDEIAAQSSACGFHPSAIVHCTGSAATQAGLVVGASIALKGTRVVGIDIDAEPERVRSDVVRYANDAANLLEASFDEADVEVIAGHAGPAYGVLHDATVEAIKLAGALEALVLDPVYSGKGLAGLIALVRTGRWQPDDNVVFLHTGGAPALFAYRSALTI